jgi:tRNA(Ile)-lysidine synthase
MIHSRNRGSVSSADSPTLSPHPGNGASGRRSISKASAGTLEEEREDVVYLDAGKVEFPIEVRGFRAGDRFIPLGMKDEKKLKNFFVDEKIPRFERYRVPIFTTGGEIFWIGGMRIDERFKVRKKGKKALKLSIRIP